MTPRRTLKRRSMPRNNDDDGRAPEDGRLAEMIETLVERWGDETARMAADSEERLARANGMAEALCAAVERASETAAAHGDICRLSMEAAADRIGSLRADRDGLRSRLAECQRMLGESQSEVRRLTEVVRSQQDTLREVVRDLARQGGNSTVIGDVSGTRNK